MLQVWVFIGSAYFIVITQISEKRDIFPHHPQGYESGFPEKEAMMTQKAEEEEKHVMTGRKMAAKCVFLRKKKTEVRKKMEM